MFPKMKVTHSEDLEFLRNIHSQFQISKSQKQGEWLMILLFGAIFPALSLLFFFCDFPVIVDKDHLVCAAFTIGLFILDIYLFRMRAVEYEFTGEEIIERRGGRIKNQIRISDIIETKVKISPHQLTLKTNNSKMVVQIIPSLNEAIQKEAAKIEATKTETDRQHFEKVKQETISRFKRANIIGAVILVLIMFALALLVGWLRRKH
jgi:hypothetical protein